jgi:hypothetical protein
MPAWPISPRRRGGARSASPPARLDGDPKCGRRIRRRPRGASSFWPAIRINKHASRMAGSVRGFGHVVSLPRRVRVRSLRGDGAPKSAKSLWLVPCGTQAPRGAPITTFSGNGPCFSSRVGNDFRLDTSASSWQGLLVAPEGAPLPPERLVATKPAGAAPRPAFATPRESAP